MNKILNYRNFKAQYWIGEFPQLPTISTSTIYEEIDNLKDIDLQEKYKICLELYLYKNAGNYGLLGIEFEPKINSNKLTIEIKYVDKNSIVYQSAINSFDRTIYCGLLKEYVPYLKENIIENIYQQNITYGGYLKVLCAANSEVGSSYSLFNTIIKIIIDIFKNFQKDKNIDIDICINDMLNKLSKKY